MRHHGFSLVELSIVLVILGLLVGGILAGQSLIRASELRSVSTGYQRHVTAVNAFRDRYLMLPGDITNAVRFWGAQAGATTDGADATCIALTTASTTTATCNGDGDRGIGKDNGAGNNTRYYETHRFWQHLANAGLVEGTYAGVGGVPGSHTALIYTGGYNAPPGKMSGSVWTMANWPTYGNSFGFGAQSGNYGMGAILIPEESWNIDTKLDDGLPGRGKLIDFGGACTTSSAYSLTSTTRACSLLFTKDFQ